MKLLRVIDLETGGFAPPHGPCEAAFTDVFYNDAGESVLATRHSTLLKPPVAMSREAINTHGITEDMVKDCHPASFVSNFMHYDPASDGVQPIDYLVAHNLRFERQWVDLREAGGICTLICGKALFPGFRSYKNWELFTQLGCHDVADLSQCEPLHRAPADTYITAHILRRLLEKATPDELVAITAGKPVGNVYTFGKYKGLKVDDPTIPVDYLQWHRDQKWCSEHFKKLIDQELTVRAGWRPA